MSQNLVKHEMNRLKRQGPIGITMATFFVFAWCYGMPTLAQTYWPIMIDFLTKSPWGYTFES
jgi:hypothetical protein